MIDPATEAEAFHAWARAEIAQQFEPVRARYRAEAAASNPYANAYGLPDLSFAVALGHLGSSLGLGLGLGII